MELSLDVTEAARPVEAAADLADWLKKARLPGVDEVRQEEMPPKPGEQGPSLESILTVVLGAPAVVAFVHCFFRYLEARRPKMKITWKNGKNSLVIDCTNPPSMDKLTAFVKMLTDD